METSLALVLVFCAFVSLSDSACSLTLLKPGAKHCVDGYDNSKHPMGSTWTKGRCIRCICSLGQMECCDTMGRVTDLTKGCIVKYDYKKCTFDVFNPRKPTIKCSYGVVGK
ncbi:beta-microseminoprotein-like [Sinocyclocheilus rhinocerous]|uniref:beta-microseminoprotein-like n=1 Tax=Sinocyclocheilus rhinocerous TaxID=307959 RepID=UPI0007BA7E17|nr:PREDICTED: beta-microseminoprotein-like [Sinocyclocheilus rhinocerous]